MKANPIKVKQTFGTVRIDHFSPQLPEGTPRAINVVLSFEEALKLHLGLSQILGKLNAYNRNTKEGRLTAANLCIFTDQARITINEDKIATPSDRAPAKPSTTAKSLKDRRKEYEREVRSAGRERTTENTYLTHARNVVRWAKGDFTPGIRKL